MALASADQRLKVGTWMKKVVFILSTFKLFLYHKIGTNTAHHTNIIKYTIIWSLLVDDAYNGNSSSVAAQISTENHGIDVSLDLLYPFRAKKILDKLTSDDVQKIKPFEIIESSIVASMKKRAITLLLKNSLTPTETKTMKLLLSSVINFVDSLIYVVDTAVK
ncbi:hypothetical protein EDC94DRAFT_579933 [Helicostylum pulchrum]|nr:hypothetical protein EDC94DRAFT_579933 [Helicostylum pulchrum]